ncbi:hypothetical protein L1987_52424 [Smallanthus sonchifolius]|uniref:Uncharacterized protein n=1 Tax=Smallanthus sonchifolius TaxID=185202 RepID=A0ACB9ETF2_9ASTR|nr:hypothetical protein L1987_52424 [Smallanthus sonchifolius]
MEAQSSQVKSEILDLVCIFSLGSFPAGSGGRARVPVNPKPTDLTLLAFSLSGSVILFRAPTSRDLEILVMFG